MGKVKLSDALLRRAHRAAVRHSALNQQLTKAFQERYGCTYSDVDCDNLIDALDYGAGSEPTVESCDAAMSESGCEVISAKASPHGR